MTECDFNRYNKTFIETNKYNIRLKMPNCKVNFSLWKYLNLLWFFICCCSHKLCIWNGGERKWKCFHLFFVKYFSLIYNMKIGIILLLITRMNINAHEHLYKIYKFIHNSISHFAMLQIFTCLLRASRKHFYAYILILLIAYYDDCLCIRRKHIWNCCIQFVPVFYTDSKSNGIWIRNSVNQHKQ